eukprot:GHVL01015952.1.p2 GENE.GHVL01015952.1~~GHVL01015952.1.p2  ORF type:complete len:117 (+),score=12.74 GHVL01015952.1:1279-1629(+)
MSELDVTWARYAQHVDLGVELDTACQPPRRHQHAHRLYISVALPLHQPAVDITRRVLCPSQATAQTHTHTHTPPHQHQHARALEQETPPHAAPYKTRLAPTTNDGVKDYKPSRKSQ